MPSTDQRHFQRLALPLPVEVYWQGNGHRAQIADLSLKGVMFELPDPHPDVDQLTEAVANDQHPVVSVVLLSDPEHIELLHVDVQLLHQNGNRFGGEWVNIEVDDLANLRQIMDLNLGDDRRIERELSELWH